MYTVCLGLVSCIHLVSCILALKGGARKVVLYRVQLLYLLPQPMMYQGIKKHAPVVEKYAQSLIKEGTVTQKEYEVG